MLTRFAHGPPTIRLGDLEVRRFGYGTMRLTGKEAWGEPADPAAAHAVLRRAEEHGINLIDTAWYYGPHIANRLIVEALFPYPDDLVIATKLGTRRTPDKCWIPALRPDELHEDLDEDLRSLRLEQIPVVHLRWSEYSDVPFDEALDALVEAKRAGKIRHLGLANVSVAQLEYALGVTPIVSVQNVFDLRGGEVLRGSPPPDKSDAVLAACEARGIAFMPLFPHELGSLAASSGALAAAADRHCCTPVQLALAWLLARSPVMLPIPGTSKVIHLDQDVLAVHIAIDGTSSAEHAPNAA